MEQLHAELLTPEYVGPDPFQGAYTYTPTQATQTVPINGKRATDDITINPIPTSFGRVEQNGNTLTIS